MRSLFLLPFLLLICTMTEAQNFRDKQKNYSRVRAAYAEKEEAMDQLLRDKGLNPDDFKLYIRAFKQEKELEVWGKSPGNAQYILLKTYPFCSSSGSLGPKRQQGDGQIPEGFYHIDRYNPASNFHLSLGINYPNTSDRKRVTAGDPGGDIFIHGNCVTVGCIPITDELIKEVYLLAVEAKTSGNGHIPVSFFPARFGPATWAKLKEDYSTQPELIRFWEELRPGYDWFEKHHSLPSITFGSTGAYVVGQ